MLQLPNIPGEIWAAVIGVGGVLLGGWMARAQAREIARESNRLESERIAADRLWQLRRVTYSDLIAQMLRFREAVSEVHDSFNQADQAEFYFQSEAYDQENGASVEAYRALNPIFHEGRLVVSEAFAGRFEQFLTEIGVADDDNNDPPERAQHGYEAAKSAYDDLLEIALREVAGPS